MIDNKPGSLFDPQGVAASGEVFIVFAKFVKVLAN